MFQRPNNNTLLLFFSFVIAVLLTSCKTDPKTETTTAITPINTAVTVGLITEPDAINPILSRKSNGRTVYRHIFNSLLQYDPISLELVPFLAKEAPEVIDIQEGKYVGGRSYTYEIRPEAQWADGKPVLASDYLFTMKIIFNPNVKTGWRGALGFVSAIEVDKENPRKFTVYTSSCKIQEDEMLATAQIYPEHVYDATGLMQSFSLADLLDKEKAESLKTNDALVSFAKQFTSPDYSREPSKVVGSGPYQLTSFETKEKVVLTKKEKWWGTPFAAKESIFTANPTKLTYKIVPDMTTATSMLKDGELDVMAEITASVYHDLAESAIGEENLVFKTPDVPLLYYFAMNTKRPMLSDKRVRQAITHLIDMDAYIAQNMYGYAARVVAPFPTNRAYYDTSLEAPQLDYDKAKVLLDEAGWIDENGDGVREKKIDGEIKELIVEIKNRPKSVDGNRIAQILKSNAQKVGMKIALVNKDVRTIFGQDVPAGDYDIVSSGIGFTPSKNDNPYLYFHTDSYPPTGRNFAQFGNAETDALIDAIITNCDDITAQAKAYKDFQAIVYEERPFLFLFTTKERIAINKRFDNAVTSSIRPGYFEHYFVAKQ